MVPNIYNKINIIWYTMRIVVYPPPRPIMENAETVATDHLFTQAGTHSLVNVKQTNMGP